MTTDELIEACDRLLHPNDQEDGYAWANAARDRIAVASALRDRLAAGEQREFERSRLLSLLSEVLACGVSYEGRPYVELQVHRTLLADILTALQDAEKGGS